MTEPSDHQEKRIPSGVADALNHHKFDDPFPSTDEEERG